MASPHKDVDTPKLKFAFRLGFDLDEFIDTNDTPRGDRSVVTFKNGTFEGGKGFEDFTGKLVGPSSDWATWYDKKQEGLFLNLKLIFKTKDGDVLLAEETGRSDRVLPDKINSKIHSSMCFETGSKKHFWMNKKVFVGKGYKTKMRLHVNYFLVE